MQSKPSASAGATGKPSTPVSLHPYRRIHPFGRLLFAGGLFAALPGLQASLLGPGLILIACMGMLCWINASCLPVTRAARLLLWLVLPVMVLHLVFTPGALLWPGGILPLTREGLMQGGWLSLKLCAMFYAAMWLSRSLSREEWVALCLALPLIGPRLLPYVQLSPAMRALASRSLASARQELRGDWRDAARLPGVLGEVFARVWHGARNEAETVWQAWGEEVSPQRHEGGLVGGVMLAVAGLLIPWLAWMAG